MTVYLLLIVFYYLMSFSEDSKPLENKNKKRRCIFLISPMFFLTAFRGLDVGTDTVQYHRLYYMYNYYYGLISKIGTSRIEPGYLFLNYISNSIGLTYFQFQVIVAIIDYAAIYFVATKYSKNISYFCFLFMTTRTMFSIMNISRSWLSTAMVLLFATKFIEKRKPLAFCSIVIAVSLFFHTSALFFLLLYPVSYTRLSKKKMQAVFVSTIVAFMFGKRFFNLIVSIMGRYDAFVEKGYSETGVAVILNLALHLCLFIIIVLMYREEIVSTTGNQTDGVVDYSIMIPVSCSLFVICIDIIGLRLNFANRVSIHFTPLYLIAFTNALAKMKKDKGYFLLKTIVSAVLVIYFVVILVYRSSWNSVVPYTTFFTTA